MARQNSTTSGEFIPGSMAALQTCNGVGQGLKNSHIIMPHSQIVRQTLKGSSKIVFLGAKLLFMANKILWVPPLPSLTFLVPITGKGGVPHKRPNAVTATFYCNLSGRKTLGKDVFPYFLNHSVKVCKRQNQFVKLCQIMTRAQTIYQFFCLPIT